MHTCVHVCARACVLACFQRWETAGGEAAATATRDVTRVRRALASPRGGRKVAFINRGRARREKGDAAESQFKWPRQFDGGGGEGEGDTASSEKWTSCGSSRDHSRGRSHRSFCHHYPPFPSPPLPPFRLLLRLVSSSRSESEKGLEGRKKE